jgi:indole-3-glycerol phosphate synthase
MDRLVPIILKSLLQQIIDSRRSAIEAARQNSPLARLREQAISYRAQAEAHAMMKALTVEDRINIIAEFKRRSPSKGLIRDDIPAADMARRYEHGGAAAISVLTEEEHFGGSLEDLRAVKRTVAIPVLRKDFILDESQVYEAAAFGADAVLLIVAALKHDELTRLRQIAEEELGLDALVEVHSIDEMRRAADSGANLIGVNNRDLNTFDVSLETSVNLSRYAPSGALLVSESGLKSKDDLLRLRKLGYRGFLIGESLMTADAPEGVIHSLMADTVST